MGDKFLNVCCDSVSDGKGKDAPKVKALPVGAEMLFERAVEPSRVSGATVARTLGAAAVSGDAGGAGGADGK